MESFLFILWGLLLIFVTAKRQKNIINLATLFIGPYVFIVCVNNFFSYRFGFYSIRGEVLILLAVTFLFFMLGAHIVTPSRMRGIEEDEIVARFDEYRMDLMINTLLAIGVIGLIKLILAIRSGAFSTLYFSESEGLMGSGLVGHLLLLGRSIAPIVLLYWTYNKKCFKALMAIVLVIVISFSSFVKYNVIGLIVSMFIFIAFYKKSVAIKALVILIGAVVSIFVLNYLIGFIVRGTDVSPTFYFNHLWNYTAGSVIYDNYLFSDVLEGSDKSILYKLGTFIFALPNMFLNRLFGFVAFPHVQKLARPIGIYYGQRSNVVDAIAYLYPKGSPFEIIFFLILEILLGMLSMMIYCRQFRRGGFDTFSCNFLTYFVFLSFFGTFFINAGPWEILVYSLVVPSIFHKNLSKVRDHLHKVSI